MFGNLRLGKAQVYPSPFEFCEKQDLIFYVHVALINFNKITDTKFFCITVQAFPLSPFSGGALITNLIWLFLILRESSMDKNKSTY